MPTSTVKDGRKVWTFVPGDIPYVPVKEGSNRREFLENFSDDEVDKMMAGCADLEQLYSWVDQFPLSSLIIGGKTISGHWKVRHGADPKGPATHADLRWHTWVGKGEDGFNAWKQVDKAIDDVKSEVGKLDRDLKSLEGTNREAQAKVVKYEAKIKSLEEENIDMAAIIQGYKDKGAADPDASHQEAVQKLNAEVTALKNDLAKAEAERDLALKTPKSAAEAASPGTELSDARVKIADLERQVAKLKGQVSTLEKQRDAAKIWVKEPLTSDGEAELVLLEQKVADLVGKIAPHSKVLSERFEELGESFLACVKDGGQSLVDAVAVAWRASQSTPKPEVTQFNFILELAFIAPATGGNVGVGSVRASEQKVASWVGGGMASRLTQAAARLWANRTSAYQRRSDVVRKLATGSEAAGYKAFALESEKMAAAGKAGKAGEEAHRSWSILGWARAVGTATSATYKYFAAPADAGMARKVGQNAAAAVGGGVVSVFRLVADPFDWVVTGESASSRFTRERATPTTT